MLVGTFDAPARLMGRGISTKGNIMQTKLSTFCDKIIEAGWLAAAIVVPLFMNVHSARSFESDKVALLRSIALVMVIAWIIKILEAGSWKLATSFQALKIPLVLPALLLAIVYIFTTVTSIVPRLSVWGSYQRMQGTYTTLSYIVIFFLTLHTLRTNEQLDRLVTIILLTSLPISLYGLMQHFGLDPFAWAGVAPAHRVVSTMGNPIFVAAYLIMVIPLTIERLVKSFSALLASGEDGAASIILATCYFFLLAMQLMCTVLSQSRGPLMGLMGGLFFFVLLMAISKRKRGLVAMIILVSIGGILFLAILNLPNTPLASLKEVPYLQRLLTMQLGGRLYIWEGAIHTIVADPVRAVIGYGPESIQIAFKPISADFVRWHGIGKTADRCHNETFDVLMTTGLIGFVAYLLLFGSLFYYGLEWLGLIVNSQQRILFMALLMIGGFFGAMIPWLIKETFTFAGLGIPAGILVALVVYLVTHSLASILVDTFKGERVRQVISLFHHRKANVQDSGKQLLLITLFSAIIAHFIEIQFGIAIAATRTCFWLYAALMTVVALFLQEEPMLGRAATQASSAKRRGRRKKRRGRKVRAPTAAVSPWNAPLTLRSLLVGLVLVTMGFVFITNQQFLSSRALSTLMPFALTWLFGGLFVTAEVGRKARPSQASFLSSYAVLSLGLFFIFLIFHGANLPPGGDPVKAIVFYYLYLFLSIVAIAVASLKGTALPARLWRGAIWWLYPLLILGMVVLIFTTNISVVQADIYYKQGQAYERDERWDESIALYQRALALDPNQDHYYKTLGWAYLKKAESDAARRVTWLEEARRAFGRGRELNPLDPDHTANLGYIFLNWEQLAADPAERVAMLNRASDYFQRAVAMSPHIQGASLKKDMVQTYLLLSDAYMEMGEFDQAAVACKGVIGLDPEQALQQVLRAVEGSPDDFASHRNLAMLYQQLGRTDEAIAEAKKAKDLAPGEKQVALDKLIAWLKVHKK